MLVEKRVDVDADQVVLVGLISVDSVRADEARIGIVKPEPQIQVLTVVGEIDLGGLGRGRTVERGLLDEIRDHGGCLPDVVIEPAVDVRWPIDPGGPDGGPIGENTEVGAAGP